MLRVALFCSGLILSLNVNAQKNDAELVVQANLDAYNQRDIDGFMQYIADDIVFYNLGGFGLPRAKQKSDQSQDQKHN